MTEEELNSIRSEVMAALGDAGIAAVQFMREIGVDETRGSVTVGDMMVRIGVKLISAGGHLPAEKEEELQMKIKNTLLEANTP